MIDFPMSQHYKVRRRAEELNLIACGTIPGYKSGSDTCRVPAVNSGLAHVASRKPALVQGARLRPDSLTANRVVVLLLPYAPASAGVTAFVIGIFGGTLLLTTKLNNSIDGKKRVGYIEVVTPQYSYSVRPDQNEFLGPSADGPLDFWLEKSKDCQLHRLSLKLGYSRRLTLFWLNQSARKRQLDRPGVSTFTTSKRRKTFKLSNGMLCTVRASIPKWGRIAS